MLFKVTLACEPFMANLAIKELLFVRMDPHVLLALCLCLETFHTNAANVFFLATVYEIVLGQVPFGLETLLAHVAEMGLEARVRSLVLV